jgi:hypothetical protein
MPSKFLDLAVPTRMVSHALHDTTAMSSSTMGISLVVTTAGVLAAQMHGDSAGTLIQLGVGTWQIPGNFKLAKSTGTTAVITGTAVVCYWFDPTGLSH